MLEFIKQWIEDPLVRKLALSIISLVLVIVIVRVTRASLANKIKDTDLRYKTRKFVTFAGYLLVVLVISAIFAEKLDSLNVALGVAGAGIAFALQEVIVSIAGWFAITFSNFYKIGDRVQLGGIKGDVIDVGILRTTLMEVGDWVRGDLYNGRVVRVANSFVFKEPVFNYSGDFPFLWDEITIPIRFGSDYKYTRVMIEKIVTELVGGYTEIAQTAWDKLVKNFRVEDARVKPLVTLIMDENWVTFTIRYVVEYKSRRTVKDRLFERLLEAIENSGGKASLASSAMEISMINYHNKDE